ncbi:MAG: hypothetical protein ACRDM2_00555 [Gaiellaceae bacterium]
MRRHRLVVPFVLALSGFGWAGAHAVAHRAVMADGAMGQPAGVGAYLSYLPTSLVLCLALALPLAAGAAVGGRWRGTSIRSLWLFGLVPVFGFVGHSAEPFVMGDGTLAPLGGLVPVVLVGLLVQIPFALVAVGLARRILWLAEGLARALAGPVTVTRVREPEPYRRARSSTRLAFCLDLSASERGPPSPAVA